MSPYRGSAPPEPPAREPFRFVKGTWLYYLWALVSLWPSMIARVYGRGGEHPCWAPAMCAWVHALMGVGIAIAFWVDGVPVAVALMAVAVVLFDTGWALIGWPRGAPLLYGVRARPEPKPLPWEDER